MNKSIIGKNYLLLTSFGLAYCGRLVTPEGLTGGVFEHPSNIHNTNNGPVWNELAANKNGRRDAAEFKHYEGLSTLPSIIAAHEWAGELPWQPI